MHESVFQRLYSKRDFEDWYCFSGEPQDRHLYEMIRECSEELFAEYRFEQNSLVDNYLKAYHQDENGNWASEIAIVPDELKYFDDLVLHSLIYRVRPLQKGVAACVSRRDYSVSVSPKAFCGENIDKIIMHETIHIYELVFRVLPHFYHDILLLSLYNDLKGKIPQLDDMIMTRLNVFLGNYITAIGGNHDILFYLKSLDLDLKCNYPLETIFMY